MSLNIGFLVLSIEKFFSKREKILLVLLILVFAIASSLVAVHRHWQFDSFWYDFGIFDETVWRLSRLELPLIPTIKYQLVWGDHFNPSILLLVPLYWLTNQQSIIIIAQVLYVALSAFFIYEIAKIKINNIFLRFSLLFSYLGYVGMQNALYTDVRIPRLVS